MNISYTDYQKRFKQTRGGLKTRLEGIGLEKEANGEPVSRDELYNNDLQSKQARVYDNLSRGRLAKMFEVHNECGHIGRKISESIYERVDKKIEKYYKNFDLNYIESFFKKIDKDLKDDDSTESLGDIRKKLNEFKKTFNEKKVRDRIARLSLEAGLTEEERKKKAQEVAAAVQDACDEHIDRIKDMQISRTFREITGRHGKVKIYDVSFPKAVMSMKLGFMIPFLGGKEPLQVWLRVAQNGEKTFEFDRNFLTRIKGVHLDVVVKEFTDFFEKEIEEGYYMEFNFRDEEDLNRICKELVKKDVKLNLKAMDLPNKYKYGIVSDYVKNIMDKHSDLLKPNTGEGRRDDVRCRHILHEADLEKDYVKVNITPDLQEHILKEHGIWLEKRPENTPKNTDTSTIRMPGLNTEVPEASAPADDLHVHPAMRNGQ